MKATRTFLSAACVAAAIFLLGVSAARPRPAQDASKKPAEKTTEKTQEKPEVKPASKLPAEIELLETRIRFETNGDSRKEVHARVKINDELGVRQFARLTFDFNRAFEQIEIPLVRITHPSGGTADVLPSAITDTPNPAVINAPAYQDVRVKSVRILGLEPGDSFEYRVITTVSHHPLAPDFWLDHTFDRSGVVAEEHFEVDLPASRKVQLHSSPVAPQGEIVESENRNAARVVHRWQHRLASGGKSDKESAEAEPDIELTTLSSWDELSSRLADLVEPAKAETGGWIIQPEISKKAGALTQNAQTCAEKIGAFYDFVSRKIATIDLPLGATGFRTRSEAEILSSGYANAEDKFKLLAALARPFSYPPTAFLMSNSDSSKRQPPTPSVFSHLLVQITTDDKQTFWLDPAIEVAPFGMISLALRAKEALALDNIPSADLGTSYWVKTPADLPFASTQNVGIEAMLAIDGTLKANVKYSMRGDNELLLRVAFHQSPKDKWNEVTQLLALSDGFRGKVSNVSTSDPYETHSPFTVEYQITQPKFVDWSKKPLRIPAILPLLGLPDPPTKPALGAAATPIDLGTPLDVEVTATLHLPAATTAHIPTGTSVQRDFATYTSQYSAKDGTLTATRHLNFILKEISADRAADYNAFLRAVQNDESQFFTVERSAADAAQPRKP